MATQGKEDVFQNVKFTSVKPNTRKASDVEFQDSENDPSSNRYTVNSQDNGHTKSKFLNVLQRKGVWLGLIALLIITLMSATMTGVVYSQIAEMKAKDTKQQARIDAQKEDIDDQKKDIDDQKLENDRQQQINNQSKVINFQSQMLTNQSQMLTNQSSMIYKLQTCTSPRVVFMAVMEKGFSGSRFTVAFSHPVIFDKDIINEGSDYRNTTGEFVCSTPGIYSFSVNALSYSQNDLCLELQHNSNIVSSLQAHDTSDAASTTAVMHLSAGDVVRVWAMCTSEFFSFLPLTRSNTFSGFLIQADDCRI